MKRRAGKGAARLCTSIYQPVYDRFNVDPRGVKEWNIRIHRVVRKYSSEVGIDLDPKIGEHSGRIVKHTGDAVLRRQRL